MLYLLLSMLTTMLESAFFTFDEDGYEALSY
jgi:hypothetical protein